MVHRLPPQIIDLLLLGAPGRRRQLQDLPILGDVWSKLAEAPDTPPDLLVIPCRDHATADVAALLRAPGEAHNPKRGDRSVAFIDGIVVATLSLQDLVDHVIPATIWWEQIEKDWEPKTPRRSSDFRRWISEEIGNLLPTVESPSHARLPRYKMAPDGPSEAVARLGLLLGAFIAAEVEMKDHPERPTPDWSSLGPNPQRIFAAVIDFLEAERIARLGSKALSIVFDRYEKLDRHKKLNRKVVDLRGSIFQVTMNREAELALTHSVPAIKADAARSLFTISCAKLGWAVIDSGIDHRHPAFLDQKATQALIAKSGKTDTEPATGHPHRIRAAFDFTRIREILGVKKEDVGRLAGEIAPNTALSAAQCATQLKRIVDDSLSGLPVDWRNIEPLVQLKLTDGSAPEVQHGTHVAGIIGADWQKRNKVTRNFEAKLQGVCPDIGLYDFRVLGPDLDNSEFAVSSALQFIRYYNEQLGYQRIHGVNMSLAIRHNVRNYACGQTPVCKQAEALVANGVVVVAAAGNRGYMQYQLADQTVYEGYAASSITDPGNADGVITVGATHRSSPHTYGVSFFSSRGPTGDGRSKPDLLAPGEKIVSCVGKDREDAMDGTSMAAPHVSGAAALLMARHEELKGNPRRIKEILCETATDLKRERQFQGHGMLDVLRAIQSI